MSPTITKKDLEEKELSLSALEKDIETRQKEVEERDRKILAEEERISLEQALLKEKEDELKKRQEELDAREKALNEVQEQKAPAPAPEPRPVRRRIKYRCIRKCFHYANPKRPEDRKIYMPGDEYYAFEGDEVPRHFMRVDSVADDFKAKKIADEEGQKNLPPYLANKTQTVHG